MGTVVSITTEQSSAKDVVVGMRVVLSVVEKEGKKSVTEVMVGTMAMPAATPPKD